jgi:hypothetical protein
MPVGFCFHIYFNYYVEKRRNCLNVSHSAVNLNMSCLFAGEYHAVHSGNESREAAVAAVGAPARVSTLIVSKVNDI